MPVSPPVIKTTGIFMVDSLIDLRFCCGSRYPGAMLIDQAFVPPSTVRLAPVM
jgi:hypothetical protein